MISFPHPVPPLTFFFFSLLQNSTRFRIYFNSSELEEGNKTKGICSSFFFTFILWNVAFCFVFFFGRAYGWGYNFFFGWLSFVSLRAPLFTHTPESSSFESSPGDRLNQSDIRRRLLFKKEKRFWSIAGCCEPMRSLSSPARPFVYLFMLSVCNALGHLISFNKVYETRRAVHARNYTHTHLDASWPALKGV